MKPGQIINKIKSKSGKEIILRFIDVCDTKNTLTAINSVVAENNYIIADKKFTLKEETKWIENEVNNLKKNKKVQVLALYKNIVIGNCGVQKEVGHKKHNGTFGITLIKSFREDGIGYELSKTAISEAKKYLDINILKLGGVYENNVRAQKLYKKLGFKKYGILPKGIKVNNKYFDEYFMYKEI